MTFTLIIAATFALMIIVLITAAFIRKNSGSHPMAEQSIIAYRYLGTFETRKKTYASLERLGDVATFEIPPEWLPDDIEPNDLVQVSSDVPGGIFEIAIVETPEDADNYDALEETYED